VDDEASFNTAKLTFWALELKSGRTQGAEPIFRRILVRVEAQVRRRFSHFSKLARFVEVEDVVQNTTLRLLRAMQEIRPESTQHFYAITNELIRREFLDLTRKYYGPHGDGTNMITSSDTLDSVGNSVEEWDQLAEFHEAVAELPTEYRETIALTFYHGWSQTRVSDFTGQRRASVSSDGAVFAGIALKSILAKTLLPSVASVKRPTSRKTSRSAPCHTTDDPAPPWDNSGRARHTIKSSTTSPATQKDALAPRSSHIAPEDLAILITTVRLTE
jgi:RNA polymerase sigma factor (sigma-70 family)